MKNSFLIFDRGGSPDNFGIVELDIPHKIKSFFKGGGKRTENGKNE